MQMTLSGYCHVDNCKLLASCSNIKEVYLTILWAHSREGHLQYLLSLETDLADAAHDEGDGAEESVSASQLLLTRSVKLLLVNWGYDTQPCSPYTLGTCGKLNKQGISVHSHVISESGI